MLVNETGVAAGKTRRAGAGLLKKKLQLSFSLKRRIAVSNF